MSGGTISHLERTTFGFKKILTNTQHAFIGKLRYRECDGPLHRHSRSIRRYDGVDDLLDSSPREFQRQRTGSETMFKSITAHAQFTGPSNWSGACAGFAKIFPMLR